jgi:MFS transporter
MNKKYISLIYLYTFLSTFILFYACDTLYYLEKGISSSGYMFFVTTSYFIKVVLEIPSGIFADKYSKKKILFIGNALFLISTLLFIISKSYALFVLAIIISSVNNCITTGIANSLLYDFNNKEDKFNKLIFRNSFSYNISYMLAMILGGIVGQKYGLINTYYLTLIPTIINFIVICLIKEPRKNNDDIVINKSIFKNALVEIKNNNTIINMIITNSIIFSIIKIVEESHPDYASSLGISVFEIGIYTSLILVFCIIGNYIGSKIKKESYGKIIKFSPLFCGLCIFLLGILNSCYGILFLLLFYIFSESFDNIFLTIVHDSVTSKSRVTIESIISLILCICGLILSLLSSLALKQIELYQLYIVLGVIIIVYGIINLVIKNDSF